MPEFEEGTSLEEQLRMLLDRLESAQSNYPCECLVTFSFSLGLYHISQQFLHIVVSNCYFHLLAV